MITYKITSFSDVWEDIKDLVSDQWGEVDHRNTTSSLNVMEDWYKSAESSGMHYMVLAEDDERVVGYSSMFIMDNPHTSSLHVISDVIYVISDYRGSGVGQELIKASEEEGKNRGADHMSITLKNGHSHENLVKGSGLSPYETVYSKALFIEEV